MPSFPAEMDLAFSPIQTEFRIFEFSQRYVDRVWNALNAATERIDSHLGINWGNVLYFFTLTGRGSSMVAAVHHFLRPPAWLSTVSPSTLPMYKAVLFLMAFGVDERDGDVLHHDVPEITLREIRRLARHLFFDPEYEAFS